MTTTRPTTARKIKCARWCDFRGEPGHAGRHVGYIGEVAGGAWTVSVTVEAVGNLPPAPFIAVGGSESLPYALAALSWDQLDQLADLLADARKYA